MQKKCVTSVPERHTILFPSLAIRPNEGGGTVVTVMVPDSAAKETTL